MNENKTTEEFAVSPILKIGSSIDNYEIIETLGHGGYGTVFQARQISTGQLVAIKALKLTDGVGYQNDQRVARFEREADLIARIQHPNIVRLIDRAYYYRQPYAVFEFIEGTTLKQYINDQKGLSANETKEIMVQILDALECAHSNGIVHRDLKPQNIMVNLTATRPHVKILDFGIGAFTEQFKNEEYKTLTLTNEVLGTPSYSAPEQLRGETPTEKSDIYAWGLIFIECMTGSSLFKGKSIAEIFQKQLMSSEVPLPAFVLGHSLSDVLRRVLRKNPQSRMASVKLIIEALKDVNFNTLHIPKINSIHKESNTTEVNEFISETSFSQRKYLFVVCVKLSLIATSNSSLDIETVYAIEKDQLNLLKDLSMRYGGHIAGELSGHLVIYFGYPETDDTDARRAGRTALEIMTAVKRRDEKLDMIYGLKSEIRISIHSGVTLIFSNQSPEGKVSNEAFELLYHMQSGGIIVGEDAKKSLEPFLNFEPAESILLSGNQLKSRTYHLIGERETEALTLLRPQSVQREMMGRNAEKDKLLNSWKNAKDRGQMLILNGQAGIGKSRLVHELKKEIQKSEGIFLDAYCLPEQENAALSPIFGMLRKLWVIEEKEEDHVKSLRLREQLKKIHFSNDLAETLIFSWLSISHKNAGDISEKSPEEQKNALFQSLKEILIQFTSINPLLFVVEDIHWMDPTTEEFLTFLQKDIHKSSLLVLLTARPLTNDRLKNQEISTIKLNPLDERSTDELIQSIVGNGNMEKSGLEYISNRTDGIPLYVEELTRMLLDKNYLFFENEKYQLISEINNQDIPSTLQGLLNARVQRLGFAQETAQIAASIGRVFRYDLLLKSSIRDRSQVENDLQLMIDADLIFRQRQVEEDSYIFRHALIRDAAYEAMTRKHRQSVHGMIAVALENEFGYLVKENPFELARHLAGAHQFERAVNFGIIASNSALELSASRETIGNAKQTLGWAEQMEESQRISKTVELYGILTSAYMQEEGWASEEVAYYSEESIRLLRDNDRVDELIPHLWWKVLGGVVGAQNEGLWEVCEELESYLGKGSELSKSVIKCAQAFYAIARGGKDAHAEGIRLNSQAVSHFDKASEKETEGHETVFGFSVPIFAKCLLAVSYNVSGEQEKAKRTASIMLDEARIENHTPSVGIALMYCAELYKLLGDRENVKKYSKELVDLCKEFDLPIYEAYGQMQLDWSNKVLDHEQETFRVLSEGDSMFSLAHYQSQYAETYAEQGNYKKAIQKIEECIGLDESNSHYYYLARMYYLKANFMRLADYPVSEIMEHTLKGLKIAEKQQAHFYVNELESLIENFNV